MNILYIFVEIIKKSTTMKNLIATLILTLSTLVSFSQALPEPVRMSEFEKIFFEEVNKYHKSHNLRPVSWSEDAYKCAYHQAYYLSDRNITMSHDQYQDRENHTELVDLSDRLYEFTTHGDNRMHGTYGIENINSHGFLKSDYTEEEYRKIAKLLLSEWVKSPGHNQNLLDGYVNQGAISVLKFECCNTRPVLVMYRK